mmetsp:Transcript_10517/g.30536  ORF Transcript_10517/g.30536 Transcript_10517/m.30536 type:complete len:207 (-) Transcript_10517:289-909(-)
MLVCEAPASAQPRARRWRRRAQRGVLRVAERPVHGERRKRWWGRILVRRRQRRDSAGRRSPRRRSHSGGSLRERHRGHRWRGRRGAVLERGARGRRHGVADRAPVRRQSRRRRAHHAVGVGCPPRTFVRRDRGRPGAHLGLGLDKAAAPLRPSGEADNDQGRPGEGRAGGGLRPRHRGAADVSREWRRGRLLAALGHPSARAVAGH